MATFRKTPWPARRGSSARSSSCSFPQSVGIYSSYDRSAEGGRFPGGRQIRGAELAIVGTELQVGRAGTGPKNWGTVIGQGLQSGISTGLLVAMVMLIFARPEHLAVAVWDHWRSVSPRYRIQRRGVRDVPRQARLHLGDPDVATKYEVLCEHKVAAEAREMLQGMPGARAAAFE